MEARTNLLTTHDPLPDHLPPDVARQILELARSQEPQDIDALIEVGMTRGLRHPRLAVEAIGMQVAQQVAREQVALARQTVKLSWLLLVATALAATAAVANVVAFVLK